MFAIGWNLPRYLGKTYCVRKCKKKLGIENLIIMALLGNICWITDLTNLLSINSIYKREDILKQRKNNIRHAPFALVTA